MIQVPWIDSPGELLLWMQAVLAWSVARYLTMWDTRRAVPLVRAVVLGLLVWALGGFTAPALVLGVFAGGMEAVFPIAGAYLARKRMSAEWEVLGTLLYVAGSGWIVALHQLHVRLGLFSVPVSAGRMASLCVLFSILLFAGRGGTRIVRGILDKVGSVPKVATGGAAQGPVDVEEYDRGRVIGNLERVLLVVTVALGAYETMGLIIAAKGLIRIKEFEKRDFAEYFLIGTLTSVIVAFSLGWILRRAILAWW